MPDIDSAAVVGTLVIVPIPLICSSKLKEMLALGPGNIIADHMVLAVPESCTYILGIQIDWREYVGGRFAKGFQGPSQSGDLWSLTGGTAGPEITQKTVVQVVGQRGGNVGGHTGSEIPGHLRAAGNRCRRSKLVPRIKAANVNLVPGGPLHFVVPVGAIEVPFGTKVVVETNYSKIVLPWDDHVAAKGQHVQMIASAKT